MTALASSRRIREERLSYILLPLAAVAVYQGGAAVIDTATGYATKASGSTSQRAVGLFAESVDNSGGSPGDLSVNVKLPREITAFRFVNGSSGDAIAATDIGKLAYFLDDQTVSIDPTGKPVAGIIWGVDPTLGVLVELFSPAESDNVDDGLTAGATLSFTAGACAIASPGRNVHYKIPTTAANSTVDLGTTGALRGDVVYFTADGSANGHTVTYRDGSTAITAAATASKRHVAMCIFDGSKWAALLTVGP